jgi:hypothetical protein
MVFFEGINTNSILIIFIKKVNQIYNMLVN